MLKVITYTTMESVERFWLTAVSDMTKLSMKISNSFPYFYSIQSNKPVKVRRIKKIPIPSQDTLESRKQRPDMTLISKFMETCDKIPIYFILVMLLSSSSLFSSVISIPEQFQGNDISISCSGLFRRPNLEHSTCRYRGNELSAYNSNIAYFYFVSHTQYEKDMHIFLQCAKTVTI